MLYKTISYLFWPTCLFGCELYQRSRCELTLNAYFNGFQSILLKHCFEAGNAVPVHVIKNHRLRQEPLSQTLYC